MAVSGVMDKMSNLQGSVYNNKLNLLLDLVPGANEVSDKVKALGMMIDYVLLLHTCHKERLGVRRAFNVVCNIRNWMKPLFVLMHKKVILQDLVPGGKDVTDDGKLLEKIIDHIKLLKRDNKVFDDEKPRTYLASDKTSKISNRVLVILKDLVPGCNEVSCVTQLLDKTIDYIKFLEHDIEVFYGEPKKHIIRMTLTYYQDRRNKLAILQELVPGFMEDIDGAPDFDKLIDYIKLLKRGNAGLTFQRELLENRFHDETILQEYLIRLIKDLLELPPEANGNMVLDEVVRFLLKVPPAPASYLKYVDGNGGSRNEILQAYQITLINDLLKLPPYCNRSTVLGEVVRFLFFKKNKEKQCREPNPMYQLETAAGKPNEKIDVQSKLTTVIAQQIS